jgi:hypothetical protein
VSFSDDQPHTRTRLPVGDLPPPPPGRRPRPLRTLFTVLGIVVLLVMAISFANRGKDTPPAANAADGTRSTGHPSSAAPTAATGQQPVSGSSNGIATGYPRTGQGAQSAAVNYAVALGSAAMYSTETRHAVLATVTDPARTAALQTRLDNAFADGATRYGLDDQGEAPAGLAFISRTIPVGTRTEALNADAAKVAVWSNGLIGLAGEGSTQPVAENWFTLTLTLHWVGNDWKVTDYRQASGPAPVNGDQQASSADEIKSAVEQYGGFRYAR